MDERVKRRLVGAAVLTVLAVIFIPMILDTSDYDSLPWQNEIPARPMGVLPEHLPHPNAEVPFVTEAEPPPAVTEPRTETVQSENTPAAPAAGETRSLDAWVVQVGSFSSEQRALKVRDQLRAMEMPAFVAPKDTPQGKRYHRVLIGPDLSSDRANSYRDRVKKELDLDAQVRRHRE